MNTSILGTLTTGDKKYKVYKDTYYSAECPDSLIFTLHRIKEDRTRIKIHYGNPKTGKDWDEQYDILGKIGRSTGTIKIPLLIHNARSFGGGAILTACIVKISPSNKKQGLKPLYQVKNYHL